MKLFNFNSRGVRLSILFIIAILINFCLFSIGKFESANNGFNRKFNIKSFVVAKRKLMHVGYGKIAGLNDEEIILINSKKHKFLRIVRNNPSNPELEYNLPFLRFIKDNYITSDYRDSNFYFFCDSRQTLFKYNIFSGQINSYFLSERFSRISTFSGNELIIRNLDSSKESQKFKIINYENNEIFRAQQNNILRIRDGGLCSDGLIKNSINGTFYMCFFLNRVYRIDTMLKLNKFIKLLDTNTVCKNKIERINGSNTFTFVGSLTQVNINYSMDSDLLIVQSALKADNESKESFKKMVNLDFYSINRNSYIGTLKLSRPNNQRLLDFYVKDGFLYCLFTQYILIYQFNQM